MNTTVNNLLNLFRLHTRRFIFFLQTKNINVICTRESRGQNEYIIEERKSSSFVSVRSRQRRWLKPKKKIKKKLLFRQTTNTNQVFATIVIMNAVQVAITPGWLIVGLISCSFCLFGLLYIPGIVIFLMHLFFGCLKKKKNTCTLDFELALFALRTCSRPLWYVQIQVQNNNASPDFHYSIHGNFYGIKSTNVKHER